MTIAKSPRSTGREIKAPVRQETADGDHDDAAITELFHRHAARVYGYARLRSSAEAAEDVVADTFLTAWRLRDRIPADPFPWLLIIARNALSNRRRSDARIARLTVAMSVIEALAGQSPATEDLVSDRDALLSAVALLTDEEREALILTAWDGLTQREAARVAGCTQSTMARRLRRARNHLTTAVTPAEPAPARTRCTKEKP